MLSDLTGYSWNPTAHRYIDNETGQFVSNAVIRDGLENVIDLSGVNMNALTQQLINNEISLANWQTGMMEQIKLTHTASAALSNGGWAQMSQADWGATGRLIRDQYDYLRNFANQIADGTQPLDGRVLVRADMYADAANTTYSTIQTRSYTEQGYDEEIRIKENDPNVCDDCVEWAGMGWQPIGTLPEPGQDSVCLTRCRCHKEFRKSAESEIE